VVVEILIDQRQSRDPPPNQCADRMLDRFRAAMVQEAGGEPAQEAGSPPGLRQRSAPPPLVICAPSERAATSRDEWGANSKLDWVRRVIAKAAVRPVLTCCAKYVRARRAGFCQWADEKSGPQKTSAV
jgi:hypothetical protein